MKIWRAERVKAVGDIQQNESGRVRVAEIFHRFLTRGKMLRKNKALRGR